MANHILLVDSDILIDHLRKPNTDVIRFLKHITMRKLQAVISVITEAEVLSGKDAHQEKVQHLLDIFGKLNVTSLLARRAGALRRQTNLALPDALIAATALSLDALLVTRNQRHFRNVPNLKITDDLAGLA